MPGGKKLVYTHISMPMTAIADFAEMAEEADEPLKSVYRELGTICKRHGDLWSKEAEDFLLGCGEIRLESVG
jgi:hypothetical protein